jgi:hypothetical protein
MDDANVSIEASEANTADGAQHSSAGASLETASDAPPPASDEQPDLVARTAAEPAIPAEPQRQPEAVGAEGLARPAAADENRPRRSGWWNRRSFFGT